MSVIDIAQLLFGHDRDPLFSGAKIGAFSDSSSLRGGTVVEIIDDTAMVLLDGSDDPVRLHTSSLLSVGDRVTVSLQGGTYQLVSIDGVVNLISDQEQELINFGNALGDLSNQIDGRVDTWFYTYTPTASNEPASTWTDEDKTAHTDDLFYNTSNGYCYRWTGSTWQQITDQRIADALAAAAKAEDTADSKRRVFTMQPTGPYDVGDLWITSMGGSGDLKACKTARSSGYSSSDWVLATKYTDDAVVTSLVNSFTMTRTVASVTKTKESSATSAVYNPTVSTTYWWVFKPNGSDGAPTIAFASIPLANVSTRRSLGGTQSYISDYTFKIAWPAALGAMSFSNLPICIVTVSANGDWCDGLVYSRDTSGLGPIAVERPYDAPIPISNARIEIMVVTRR